MRRGVLQLVPAERRLVLAAGLQPEPAAEAGAVVRLRGVLLHRLPVLPPGRALPTKSLHSQLNIHAVPTKKDEFIYLIKQNRDLVSLDVSGNASVCLSVCRTLKRLRFINSPIYFWFLYLE